MLLATWLATISAPALPVVSDVEFQPLAAQVRRVIEAAQFLGAPISPADAQTLEAAFDQSDSISACTLIQEVLDRYCLLEVTINPENRVKVVQGPAEPVLVEKGWRQFLVKVHNQSGSTAVLRAVSPQALSVYDPGYIRTDSDAYYRKSGPQLPERELWLDAKIYTNQPMRTALSGYKLEYRVLQLYSRDSGQRQATLALNIGSGTQDVGFRSETDILFDCLPASPVTFRVKDENGEPATAAFLIRDRAGRVYPSQAKRLAPDFPFQPQVYRADGNVEPLPPGLYKVEYSRGPEYRVKTRELEVTTNKTTWDFRLERWIDPAQLGYWSGDHHIHAAGCSHYTKPTEGVHAKDMIVHCLGEDLKVGCNLTWGPCFDYQKQFFTGQDDRVSQYPYLLHYDVEVSGFGSHQSGHLCLLGLKEQIPPGGDSDKHWPTLCLNTLRWAKRQGAICGPAHSGWGLEVDTKELPNYVIPPFNGIGAMEYIVDVTHQVEGPDGKLIPAVDFLSTVDTSDVWELNLWYHILNAGFRTRISGETDFPCIYDDRVGIGRSYVKLGSELSYHAWCEGIQAGRNYVSEGRSHLMDFNAQPVSNHGQVSPDAREESGQDLKPIVNMGESDSELKLNQPGRVKLKVRAAALLNDQPGSLLTNRPYADHIRWDIERARIGSSRQVPVEVVVNGYQAARRDIEADGSIQDLTFDVDIKQSSWVAIRILPSSHTNPIWIMVGGKPVRASRRSVEWCLKGVDQCWKEKQQFIAAGEIHDAQAAYDHARQVYRRILAECQTD